MGGLPPRLEISSFDRGLFECGGNNREIGYPISGCVQFDLQRKDRPTRGGSLNLSAAIVEAIIQAAAFHLPPVKANRRWPTPNPAKIRASSIGILTMEPVPGMSAFPTMMMRRFAGQKLISESIAIKIARMLVTAECGEAALEAQLPLTVVAEDAHWVVSGAGSQALEALVRENRRHREAAAHGDIPVRRTDRRFAPRAL